MAMLGALCANDTILIHGKNFALFLHFIYLNSGVCFTVHCVGYPIVWRCQIIRLHSPDREMIGERRIGS